MAQYYREELSMLMGQVATYNAKLITAKTKRQRRLIESDISVCLAEIEDAYRDLATEILTTEM